MMDLPLKNPPYVAIPIRDTTAAKRQDHSYKRLSFIFEPYPLAVIRDGDIRIFQALSPILQTIGLILDRPAPFVPPTCNLMLHPHFGGFRIQNPHWMLALSPHWYIATSPVEGTTYVSVSPYFNDTVPPGSIIWTKGGA